MKSVSVELLAARRPTPALWVVAGIALLVAASMAFWAWRQQQATSAARAALQLALATQAADQPPPVLVLRKNGYERSAREMLLERSLPWPEALTALEATAMVGATPRAVDANASDGTVRVEVIAASHSRLLAYVDALNAGGGVDGDTVHWALQQTQSDPANNGVVSIIVGRRVTVSAAVPGRGNRILPAN